MTSAIKKSTPRRKQPRSCGECHACCVTLGFEAREGEASFAKPHGVACPQLVQLRCGIYADRPPVCRRFECGWLSAPNLPDSLRPDRSGVLFSLNSNLHGDGDAVYAYELRPGALETGLVPWIIGKLTDQGQVVILVRDREVEVLTAAAEPEPEKAR